MKSILFLGDQHKSEFEGLITSAIQVWAQDWCFKTPKLAVEFLCKNSLDDIASPVLFRFGKDEHVALLGGLSGAMETVLFSGLDTVAPKDDVLTKMLADAQESLLANILAKLLGCRLSSFTLNKLGNDTSVFASESKVGDSSVSFRISLGEFSLTVALPMISTFSFLSPERKRRQKFQKVNAFGLPGTVSASVNMALGEFSIADIKNLSVGDVLGTGVPLTSQFSLSVGDKEISSVFLGKSNDHKAVLLQNLKK